MRIGLIGIGAIASDVVLYLKDNKWAKVEIALARGKKLYDKRRAIAEREAQREVERALARRR